MPPHRSVGPPAPRPLDYDVGVVGGGPTGLAAANLLGTAGVSTLLVERNLTTSDDAKAISLDDESMRTLQLTGLDDDVYRIIVPGTGTKYFGADGRALVHARGASYRFGHPFKNPFAQPELERVLRDGVRRFPPVRAQFGTTLVDLEQHPDRVSVTLESDGGRTGVDVGFLLGCDGGRSTVRDRLGIAMTGRSFDEVWLVVDTVEDPHDQRYGMHHGDPRRPHVIVPGRDGRCRYEFLLTPDEGPPTPDPPFGLVERLVRPYRPLQPHQVERAVSYRFHALLADRFRDHRVLLLGDAAHMMPPFAGQGLNSGLRDAANVAWKVADVVTGQASAGVLDSYETERRPHARAVIELSVRLGQIVMTTSPTRARLRDATVRTAMRTPIGRRYLSEMRYRPSPRIDHGVLVHRADRADRHLLGRPFPQPRVLAGSAYELVRLDDVLGAGWSTLGVEVSPEDWDLVAGAGLPGGAAIDVVLADRTLHPTGDRPVVGDADGRLESLLAGQSGRFVLLRPDRVVAAVFDPTQADGVVRGLSAAGIRPRLRTPVGPDGADRAGSGAPVATSTTSSSGGAP